MTTNAHTPIPNAVLSDLRASVGLSQQEVAERVIAWATANGRRSVGVTANTVSRWERGTVVPGPFNRRALAAVFNVGVEELGFAVKRDVRSRVPIQRQPAIGHDDPVTIDPRVASSQDEWRRTRQALNSRRSALTQIAAQVYDQRYRLNSTGLITHPDWFPNEPVDLAAVDLTHTPDAPPPTLDGTEPETAHVRPLATLVRPYPRYTHAIRDLERPRLFENRASWRLIDLAWTADKGRMAFSDCTYFAGVDIYEAVAHELALVHLGERGTPRSGQPVLRDLPFRRLIGDPFAFSRRPILPSISTLTIRRDADEATFLLHRRDPASVAVAGGMLQVIPSGVFQPSSVMPAAVAADFDLWRNIMREYSEELLGNPEHDGDGQPIDYGAEPFRYLDQARQEGKLTIWCLGVALDALTLVGEILTVAVFDADVFDELAGDFVDLNDEGAVINDRVPFTEAGVQSVLDSGRLAPAGAGCIAATWQHRDRILGRKSPLDTLPL